MCALLLLYLLLCGCGSKLFNDLTNVTSAFQLLLFHFISTKTTEINMNVFNTPRRYLTNAQCNNFTFISLLLRALRILFLFNKHFVISIYICFYLSSLLFGAFCFLKLLLFLFNFLDNSVIAKSTCNACKYATQ